jgi:inorganic triphosphatase YgiF
LRDKYGGRANLETAEDLLEKYSKLWKEGPSVFNRLYNLHSQEYDAESLRIDEEIRWFLRLKGKGLTDETEEMASLIEIFTQ